MEALTSNDIGEYTVATMKPSEVAREQFEDLLQQHGGIIRKVAFGYAWNESDRNDLIQDILLQLWKAYPRYSSARSPPGCIGSPLMFRFRIYGTIPGPGVRRCSSVNRSTTSLLSNPVRRK